ncbi:MAG: hypothetical protein PHP59_10355 [Methanofollis sp.]|uniref:hypothetical protein n=1 Tax=Methanofollis sp. TaxID=2052835 RepID=UPI00261EA53F|nr:hypothetical protein [Methanofollis sp.]MDD4255759.1 hypothetical protein [Methanofollis sp.]
MGASKEAVYNTVERDLKKAYRAEEGWTLARRPQIAAAPDYLLSRKRSGKTENVLVNVRLAAVVGADEFSRLKEMTERCAAHGMAVNKAVLVVPQDVVLPGNVGDVDLFYLNTYAVKNGEVIWSRSNLRTSEGKMILETA